MLDFLMGLTVFGGGVYGLVYAITRDQVLAIAVSISTTLIVTGIMVMLTVAIRSKG